MKGTELAAKTEQELRAELVTLLKAQFSLRMQRATQQLTKNSEIKKVRRDIARIRTILGQKVAKNERS
ncbi:MAG: 50S ribosomal protein L29 [Neisseriales bacterium]|nr:MAG: 50S ribosomal protein L29 [Neisseriales bacterium]